MDAIWKEIKTTVKKQIPAHSYKMWIEPVEFLRRQESCVVLACKNTFSRKRLLEHYAPLIVKELKKKSGMEYQLVIEISTGKRAAEKGHSLEPQLPLPNLNVRPHSGRLLRCDFTFDKFVVGDNSDFAYSAALSLATHRNNQQASLFLQSNVGMGKSHLSQAIGHHILSKFPSERVYYITAEDFTNEMVYALRHDRIEQFKEKYRYNCDALLIEDVHFLSGKERTQLELCLTLDTLLDAEKKIIFSSSYLPANIPKLHDNLRSRLSGGLISRIDAPNFRTRVRILQKKCLQHNYIMPNAVTDYLAGELTENVRQLESGLIGVAAKSSLLGNSIDIHLAKSVVENIARRKKNITLDVIKKIVSKYYNVPVTDLVSRSRKQKIVKPRQIAIYLARRYTDQPLQAIGKSFNRYHATAIYAISAVEQGLKESARIKEHVKFFSDKLESGNF